MKKSFRFKVSGLKLKHSVILIILIGLMVAACHSGTKKAGPAIQSNESGVGRFVVSEEMHNFGSLKSGEIVSYSFSFRNEGDKTLIIKDIDPGCGCTEVKIKEKSIEPGKEGQLEVIFNSAGEAGNVLKVISITSNAEQPTKQILIRANVINEFIEINS